MGVYDRMIERLRYVLRNPVGFPPALQDHIWAAVEAEYQQREQGALAAVLFVSVATQVPAWRIVLQRQREVAQ